MRTTLLIALACVAGCYTGIDLDGFDPAASGSGGSGSGAGEPGDRTEPSDGNDPPEVPASTRSALRRLTAAEYDNTVRDLLAEQEADAALYLPADPRAPFDNGYAGQIPSAALVEGSELLAGDIAQRLLSDPVRRDEVIGCMPDDPDPQDCIRSFIARLGRRAFRRPLSEEEIDGRVQLFADSSVAGDFWFGVDLVLRSLLTDPAFLYRVEVGEEVAPGVFRLDGYEVATRLSYLIWGSMPDDALLDRAEAGELDSRSGVLEAAKLMLDDPRALQQARRFHALWLGYEGLAPAGELAADARQETEALFERVLGGGEPWSALFTLNETYVTDALADHYALPRPPTGRGWVPYGDSGRAGLLSHASFLAVGTDEQRTSPSARGIRIREQLLCQEIPEPPDDINPTLPSDGPTNCKDDKYAMHLEGACAGCHGAFDGIGFGLEQWDGLGRFVLFEPDDPMTEYDESQCELVADGNLLLDEEQPFSGPGELGALFASSDAFTTCMLEQFQRFAVGRIELDGEELERVKALGSELGTQLEFEDVILGVVGDESFRHRSQDDLEE